MASLYCALRVLSKNSWDLWGQIINVCDYCSSISRHVSRLLLVLLVSRVRHALEDILERLSLSLHYIDDAERGHDGMNDILSRLYGLSLNALELLSQLSNTHPTW